MTDTAPPVRAPLFRPVLMIPWAAWSGLVLLNMASTAHSQTIALQRNDIPYNPLHAWLMEGSSALFLILAFGIVIFLSRRFPLDELLVRWQTIAAYLAGSLVFSLVHTTGMFSLRFTLWPTVFGIPYDAPRSLIGNVFFEYQKDIVVYLVAVLGMYLFNSMMTARRAVSAAREDARSTRRITLKCGVRTVYIEADRFVAANAAANYADVEFDSETFFARISLSELHDQLEQAGIRAVRVHKSWVINADKVREVEPRGDGTRTITLISGKQVPCGRRYRDALDAGASAKT